MISAKSAPLSRFGDSTLTGIKYVNRGHQGSVALIPGWANDYRIFSTLDLRFNYLIPVDFSPFTFEEKLLKALKEHNITKISLFGHSLGGFVASDFASKHEKVIDEIILVGIRKRYKTEELEETRKNLKKNKKGFLYKIYSQCFPRREDMLLFKENLFKIYCEELELDDLLRDLDYFENAEIKPESLKGIKKIKIIHGEHDNIAPLQEAIDIKNKLPHAKFVCIKGAGHIPYLRKDFARFI